MNLHMTKTDYSWCNLRHISTFICSTKANNQQFHSYPQTHKYTDACTNARMRVCISARERTFYTDHSSSPESKAGLTNIINRHKTWPTSVYLGSAVTYENYSYIHDHINSRLHSENSCRHSNIFNVSSIEKCKRWNIRNYTFAWCFAWA
jgi:hypothetical protein